MINSLRHALSTHRIALRAIACMTLSAFCFAFVEIVLREFISGITLHQVVWGRYAVHLLLMVALLGPRYNTQIVRTSRLGIQIVRSMTMLAMPVCFIVALNYMPPNDIWAAYWASPLMMLGLSVWILHERAGTTRWIAAVVGFIGMLVVFRPDRGILTPAVLLGFGGGLAISMHLMFSRILRNDHALASLFHTALWVFIAMSCFVPFVWQNPSLLDSVGVAILGLVGLITLYYLARAGELVPIPVVAVFSFTEAIWRQILTTAIFLVRPERHALPTRHALVGTLIIAAVTIYSLYYELRQTGLDSE